METPCIIQATSARYLQAVHNFNSSYRAKAGVSYSQTLFSCKATCIVMDDNFYRAVVELNMIG